MKKSLVLIALFLAGTTLRGAEYFQQEVNYTIRVALDDNKHLLRGHISFEYINHSPDTLRHIYIHLWPNAYKDNNTALARQLLENGETALYYASEEDKGFIDSLLFSENGRPSTWEYDQDHNDICRLVLSSPLAPGARTIISSPFRVKLPSGDISRLGHDEQSYQITQWYPKPAVYDRYGWHPMPYLNQGEFYSEFGSYDVSITLPKNYVVGATGDLVDGDSELEWLGRKAAQTELIKTFEYQEGVFPPSDPETKTLHYKQKNVHDFAWFADKRYHVLKGQVELPHSKRTVTTWAMFTGRKGHQWKNSTIYLQDAIYYYSLWNGDYPYNQATAVDGSLTAGGGMEYPNVTVISDMPTAFALEMVIMHEVGHNWFYGILGTNEREHPWMDEGINSFNENRYIETKYPNRSLLGIEKADRLLNIGHLAHKAQYEMMYLAAARKRQDQPIELPASQYTEMNYGSIVYSKTAIVFDYLMAYLGPATMDKCMQAYFEKWKFKHPYPDDLRRVMEEVSGKQLGWFFDGLINTTQRLDYKIMGIKKEANNIKVLIKNSGEIAAPVQLGGMKNGKPASSAWYEGFAGTQWVDFPPGDYDMIKIDPDGDMPEINRRNNSISTSGLFKKCEPLDLQFFSSLEDPRKSQVFYAPVAGWNNHNKLMAGMLIHNYSFPSSPFRYYLMPMYATGNNSLAGSADISYTLFPKKGPVESAAISVFAKRYAFAPLGNARSYHKAEPRLRLNFRKAPRSKKEHQIELRSTHIIGDPYQNSEGSVMTSYYSDDTTYSCINRLSYVFSNTRTIHPYDVKTTLEQSKYFIKAFAEANFEVTFNKKNKGIFLRVFGGKFIYTNNASSYFGFGMSGNSDYTYDHIFLGRSTMSGLLSQQMILNDGGFKQYTLAMPSVNYLASVNLLVAPPFPLPLALYADAGITDTQTGMLSDAGVALNIIPKYCVVYFPFYTSSNLNMLSYAQKIRFVLNINMARPFEMMNQISF